MASDCVEHFQPVRPVERPIAAKLGQQVGDGLDHFGRAVGLWHRSDRNGPGGPGPADLPADQQDRNAQPLQLPGKLDTVVAAAKLDIDEREIRRTFARNGVTAILRAMA